jgi:succinoglycan biosynthesis protein ExoO
MPPVISPMISIVIAAYNASGFIGRAIASVQAQSFADFEILVINDCSTDSTLEVVNKLAADDARIRVFSLDVNRGPAAARNRGLDEARGRWVAVLDADDAYLPDRLAKLLAAAERNQADIVADNFHYFDPTTGQIRAPELPTDVADRLIDRYDFITHARPYGSQVDWGLLKPMFRLQFLNDQHLRYPEFTRHGEDFLFIVHALLRKARYALTSSPGYIYTDRSSGWSRTRVDYDAMIEQSRALLTHPQIRDDARLLDLLHIRMRAVAKLSTEHKRRHYARERHYFNLFLLILRNPPMWGWLLRRIARSVPL